MAYNEALADKIREVLVNTPIVDERNMFGGVCFMVNEKMCVGVIKDEMMCRIDPKLEEIVLEKDGCRQMDFTRRAMKGYVFVDADSIKNKSVLEYWINLCLDFNPIAKASKKKRK